MKLAEDIQSLRMVKNSHSEMLEQIDRLENAISFDTFGVPAFIAQDSTFEKYQIELKRMRKRYFVIVSHAVRGHENATSRHIWRKEFRKLNKRISRISEKITWLLLTS